MSYILILIAFFTSPTQGGEGNAVATTTIEFKSSQACQAAAQYYDYKGNTGSPFYFLDQTTRSTSSGNGGHLAIAKCFAK